MVVAVPLCATRCIDARGAGQQPRSDRRAGSPAAGPRKLQCRGRWRPASRRGCAARRVARARFRAGHRPARTEPGVQSLQCLGQCVLYARCIRRRAAPTGGIAGADRVPAVPVAGGLSGADGQSGHGERQGGLAARADRGDRAHRGGPGAAARSAYPPVRPGRREPGRGARAAHHAGADPRDPAAPAAGARTDPAPDRGTRGQAPQR